MTDDAGANKSLIPLLSQLLRSLVACYLLQIACIYLTPSFAFMLGSFSAGAVASWYFPERRWTAMIVAQISVLLLFLTASQPQPSEVEVWCPPLVERLQQLWSLGIGSPMALGVLPISAAFGVGLVSQGKLSMKTGCRVLLGLMVVGFLLQSYTLLPEFLSLLTAQTHPMVNDAFLFEATHRFMVAGHDFYWAFQHGVMARTGSYVVEGPAFRQPLIFVFWGLCCPDAAYIHTLYCVGTFATVWVGYLLLEEIAAPPAALVGAALYLSYNVFASITPWFLYMEYWALFLTMGALYALHKSHNLVPAILLLLAALTREYFALTLLLVAGIQMVMGERRVWRIWIPTMLCFAALYYWHYSVALASIHEYGGTSELAKRGFSRWQHGGTDALLLMLQYGTDLMPGRRWICLLFPALAFFGLATQAWKGNKAVRTLKLMLAATSFVPMLLFLKIGNTASWYYGAIFLPLQLWSIPLALIPEPSPLSDEVVSEPVADSAAESSQAA